MNTSTTYRTAVILLEEPFLKTGHLFSSSYPESHNKGEKMCKEAAFRIWRLLEAYKSTFTLRRAPYLISYAADSVALVILQQASKRLQVLRMFAFLLVCTFRLTKGMQFLMKETAENLEVIDASTPQKYA
jgi:hypothetical protein